MISTSDFRKSLKNMCVSQLLAELIMYSFKMPRMIDRTKKIRKLNLICLRNILEGSGEPRCLIHQMIPVTLNLFITLHDFTITTIYFMHTKNL